jgi:hypothetical protein
MYESGCWMCSHQIFRIIVRHQKIPANIGAAVCNLELEMSAEGIKKNSKSCLEARCRQKCLFFTMFM